MKVLMLYRFIRYIVTYHLLSFLVVCFVQEIDGVFGKTDLKTKLLLQNIRNHLAQKADEIVKKKECESGLILCKNPKSKETEGEEDKSEEIPPPPKLVRGQQKPAIKVNTKDVIQTLMPKARKNLFRRTQKTEKRNKQSKISFSEESLEQSDEPDDASGDKSDEVDDNLIKNQIKSTKQPLRLKEKPQQGTHADLPNGEKKNQQDSQLHTITTRDIIEKKKLKTSTEKNKKGGETEKVKKSSRSALGKEAKEDTLIFQPEALIFVLDPNDLQNDLCRKHSQIYLKQLKKYQIWALMMYDASGKVSSGILQGNVNQYGDFDECLAINAVFKNLKLRTKESPGIKGKYCLAAVDVMIKSDNKNLRSALDRVESFQFVKSTIQDPGHFIPRFSTINWGVCVPSTCLAQDVEKFLISRLDVFSNATGFRFDISVDETNCVVKDDLKFKFETGTIMAILFYIVVATVSLYATFIDTETYKTNEDFLEEKKIEKELEEVAKAEEIRNKTLDRKKGEEKLSLQEKAKEIVMAFSIKKNLKLLFNDNNKGAIECINGIKSIFTIMLYVAHKTIPLGMTPYSNRVFLTKISNQPITILLRASIIYTDSFLLISGILTSYNLAKEISEGKNISWAKKLIARFIRLTPALLAALLFYAYIWDHLNSGPIWNLIVQKTALLCRDHMWRNLLYIQNFFAFENMCAPQTHQLALDMQLSIIAPLFVHLIHVYGKAGLGILQALILLSSIMRYISASKHELSVVIYHGMPVSQLYKTANLLYAQTFHRASPYILGVIVGYHLNKFGNRFQIPKAFAALGWIISFSLGFYSVVTSSPLASKNYQYDVHEAAQYAALSPVAWSFALSWLIVACHLGYGGFLNEFLSRKVFLIFSRISYSVYLTQFLVFFYKVGVKRVPEIFTIADSLNPGEFFMVIGVSVIVTLFFDIPMMKIKKIILEKNTAAPNFTQDDKVNESTEQFKIPHSNAGKHTETISPEDSQKITKERIGIIGEENEYENKEDKDIEYEGNAEVEIEVESESESEGEGESEGDFENDEDEELKSEKMGMKEDSDKYSEEETIDDDDIIVEEVLEIRPVKHLTEK